jgi:uncharacterized protein YndB with AHSA1/START domain
MKEETMTLALTEMESLSLAVNQEICVNAPIGLTFEALLEQIGPANEKPDGTAMPMRLEAWPGGRWFRDLGGDNGHFWATVKAIKRPTLLEFVGPLFMSSPVANNVQYRLSEENGLTAIKFRHRGFGLIEDDQRKGVVAGWNYLHEQVCKRAERFALKK